MPINVQSTALAAISVFGAQVPSAGPSAVPVPLDFSVSDTYSLDYSNSQRLGRLQLCQTVFIDTSQTDTPFSISFDGTGQILTVPGRTQGYYSVLAANPLKMNFSCPGGNALVSVILMNFPVANAQWKTQ
jgi:hypothetical protein